MQYSRKRYLDSKGIVTRPVYSQLEIPVWELLHEMKYKYGRTYSELISDAIVATYAAESEIYPTHPDAQSGQGEAGD